MKIIVAEKPIAAKRIADILGRPKSLMKGSVECYSLDDTIVVPLKGHITNVDFPHEYSDWGKTDLNELVNADIHYDITNKSIARALESFAPQCDELQIATDYDREGESIGKEAVEIVTKKKPTVKITRAKFSALTPQEVTSAFSKPSEFSFNLADSADTRREIDLIWGAVLTRYVSLTSRRVGKEFLSVGRVQTPALALIVEREKEIKAFKPRPFWTVYIVCDKKGKKFIAVYEEDKIFDKKKAEEIAARKVEIARVKSVEKKRLEIRPPSPFNTTEFLRSASMLGYQPQIAMSIAEKLYMNGLVSYPRTDNTVYPTSIGIKSILESFKKSAEFGEIADSILKQKKITPTQGKKRATDHPPIYPVEVTDKTKLSKYEWSIYELIVRRFFATLSPAAEIETVKVVLDYNSKNFIARGKTIIADGWREYYPYSKSEETILPELEEKEIVAVDSIKNEQKETKPKPRYTPAALLKLLEEFNLGTKCLAGDTSVKVLNDDHLHHLTLTSLFDSCIKKIKDSELEIGINERYLCLSTHEKGTLQQPFPIISKRRLKQNEKMFEVTFSDGVKIKATQDHLFYVFNNGSFSYVPAKDLKNGDRVVCLSHSDKIGEPLVTWSDFIRGVDKKTNIFASIDLKKERIKLKLSQKQFSKRFGSSQGNLSSYENRKRDIPLWLIKQLEIVPKELTGVNKNLRIPNPFPICSSSSLTCVIANLWGDGSLDAEKMKKENCYDFRYTNTNLDLLKRFSDNIYFVFKSKPKIVLNKNKLVKPNHKLIHYVQLPSLIGRLLYPIFINPKKYTKKQFYPDFIGAFFDDEGHAYKNERKIFISNTNPFILKTLKDMLDSLDIESAIDTKQFKLFVRKEKSVEKFLEKIPIASTSKKQRIISMLSTKFKPIGGPSGESISSKEKKILLRLIEGDATSRELSYLLGYSTTPIRAYLRNLMRKNLVEHKILSKNHKLKRSVVYYLKRPFFDTYYAVLGEEAIAPNLTTRRIIATRQTQYSGFVYDLSVNKETPNFALSNGVIMHNSTRAEILQKLIDRGYIQGRQNFTPSNVAFAVIDALEQYAPDVTKPDMTAKLEKEIDQVERGRKKKTEVVMDSRKLLRKVLGRLIEHKESVGEKLKDSLKTDNIVGKCPSCGGNLIVIRMRKGTRFVGCSGYSKGCRTSFPLPAKGMIKPLNTACEVCGLPMIEVKYTKRRPFRMCVNHKCSSKANWGKKAKK